MQTLLDEGLLDTMPSMESVPEELRYTGEEDEEEDEEAEEGEDEHDEMSDDADENE